MIKFTDDCLIGIEQLDEEHRYLFDLLNHGMDLLQDHRNEDSYDDIKALLHQLDEYAEMHFEHEEAYMKEIRDPELPNQRTQHNLFRNRVHNWYFKNLNTSEEQAEVLEEMMTYMLKWLYGHIIGSDILIGKLPPLEEWMLKENPCEFTDDYLTGIDLIDAEHRELFKIISQINDMVKYGVEESDFDNIKEIVAKLDNYVQDHFKDEEEYMESIQYEGIDVQKFAHEAFIAKIGSLDFEVIKEHPQDSMEKLVEFLTQWLIQHILYLDKKIG